MTKYLKLIALTLLTLALYSAQPAQAGTGDAAGGRPINPGQR